MDDKTLEENIGQFIFDLGIATKLLDKNKDGGKWVSSQKFSVFHYMNIKNLWACGHVHAAHATHSRVPEMAMVEWHHPRTAQSTWPQQPMGGGSMASFHWCSVRLSGMPCSPGADDTEARQGVIVEVQCGSGQQLASLTHQACQGPWSSTGSPIPCVYSSWTVCGEGPGFLFGLFFVFCFSCI